MIYRIWKNAYRILVALGWTQGPGDEVDISLHPTF